MLKIVFASLPIGIFTALERFGHDHGPANPTVGLWCEIYFKRPLIYCLIKYTKKLHFKSKTIFEASYNNSRPTH